jgi:hypothetical protein
MAYKRIMTAEVTVDNTVMINNLLHEQVRNAINETLLDMEMIANSLVPVDTGDLKGSIRKHLNADGLGGVVSAGGGAVDYAAFVELGHYSTGGNWVPPQPYMQPAADYGTHLLQARLDAIL